MARKRVILKQRSVTTMDALIGQRLKARRLEQHMSQADLGEHLGVTFQQVQKYEKGVNRIGAVRLQQIANCLETDVNYFMGDMTNGKLRAPSKLSAFMATKDGIDIVEAMMKLDNPDLRRSVISLARTLGSAFPYEAGA
jgi:transcriptional regulator with XRE-family HTH domain